MVLTKWDTDEDGQHLNRHYLDGRLSALSFYKLNGWPIYHPRMQFRMADGQFDLSHWLVYKDLEFKYATSCEVSREEHSTGRALEAYFTRLWPGMTPSPPGKLFPVFVHCRNTTTLLNKATGAKRNEDQCKTALDFLNTMVSITRISARRIGMLLPYRGNVTLTQRLLDVNLDGEYDALQDMEPVSTVDSYQGQEKDIMCVVMGTTKQSGPGFTSQENRLNVMLSRQKEVRDPHSTRKPFGDTKATDMTTGC